MEGTSRDTIFWSPLPELDFFPGLLLSVGVTPSSGFRPRANNLIRRIERLTIELSAR